MARFAVRVLTIIMVNRIDARNNKCGLQIKLRSNPFYKSHIIVILT